MMIQEQQKVVEKETGRVEAFSDGVFAIAMTLLALDLHVPHLGPGSTGHALMLALVQDWPSYLAFVTSFFTVLVMWVNHHHMFALIRRVSPKLQFSNGLLLLMTTTVPFTSALVAEYFRTPSARVACDVSYIPQFERVSLLPCPNVTSRIDTRGY